MGLTRVAITRPVAITMLFLALAAMGIVAYLRLPVERFPPLSFPAVSVSVSYPGAAPQDVESLVTIPIENAVIGINGVSTITSTSSEGSSRVSMQFAEGSDVNAASIDVERKINQVRRQLPSDASDPSISKADFSAFPVMNISVSSNTLNLTDLTTIVNDQIQPLIQSVNGVADATVVGGAARQIQVRVDTNKLKAYGLSLNQVQTALANQNVGQPGGPIRTQTQVFNTRTIGLLQRPQDFNNIVISTPAGGGAAGAASTASQGAVALSGAANIVAGSTSNQVVHLSDVATITDGPAPKYSFQRLNGKTSLGMSITAQSGVNGIQLANDIRSTLNKIQSSLGKTDIQFAIVNDQSIFTKAAVNDVERNLLLAILLTAAVLLMFLHTVRNTLMVLVAIPTSLVSTFLVMYFMGFNLDTMSLMALALLIGILVDDSIVVLENINRHLAMGKNPIQAALDGRSEIGLAAIAITMTDVVVYTPVAFMAGNIGQLFKEFGLTIVVATLFSLLVSFTLTPMLASKLLHGEALEHIAGNNPWAKFTRAWERGYNRIARGYRALLGHALNVRWLPVLVGIAMIGFLVLAVQTHVVGQEFTPKEDDNQFNVSISMPVGTAVNVTDGVTQQVEGWLKAMPEVKNIYTSVGGGFGGTSETNANIQVELVDKGQRSRTVFDISNQIAAMGLNVPGARIFSSVPSPLIGGGGGSNSINVVIRGQDQGVLQNLTRQVMQIVQDVPGTSQVRTGRVAPAPEYRAIVDPQRAADQGVTATTIAQTVRTAVQGVTATQFQPQGQNEVPVVLQLQGAETMTPDQLAAIPILTTKGTLIRLDQVATIVRSSSPSSISRYNRAREVEVQGSVVGRQVGDVLRDVQGKINELALPTGYTVTIGGQGTQLNAAYAALLQAMLLSIILMYMLMAALYESFIYPFAVLLCLPVALVGAFLGLIAVGDTINIFSLIGMIMLVGLVAKNAILLVDYANTLRRRGMSRREALMEAGPTRLRPILMTTTTLVFAMIPLALKLGDGAESRSPMAVVVLGGMITSTLLTLVLVPCAYTYLDDVQNFVLRRRKEPAPRLALDSPAPMMMAGGSEDAVD
jgi:HAE1 family hydrophobic/amphiphilic exporter-1